MIDVSKLAYVRIAQVGVEKPPTARDQARVLQVGVTLKIKAWQNDIVNLLYGRDFLTEDLKYDVVVVHSVFHTNHPTSLKLTIEEAVRAVRLGNNPPVPISPAHSLENWRKRLVSTEAQHIFVFESDPLSLSGWNLGTLPGYESHSADARVFHYRRNS